MPKNVTNYIPAGEFVTHKGGQSEVYVYPKALGNADIKAALQAFSERRDASITIISRDDYQKRLDAGMRPKALFFDPRRKALHVPEDGESFGPALSVVPKPKVPRGRQLSFAPLWQPRS